VGNGYNDKLRTLQLYGPLNFSSRFAQQMWPMNSDTFVRVRACHVLRVGRHRDEKNPKQSGNQGTQMVHEDFENRSLGDDKRNESIPPIEFSGKFVKIENVTVHFHR
jgi:hypothetical protein